MSQDNLTKMLDSEATDQVEPKKEVDETSRITSVKEKFGENIDEIAKAKSYADEFIEQLKSENEQLRAKERAWAEEKKKLEEFALKGAKEVPAKPTAQDAPSSVDKTGLDEATIADLVRKELSSVAETKQAADNANKAYEELLQFYGSEDKAKAAMASLTGNKTYMKDFYKSLAMRDPSEFVATVKSRVPVESIKTNAPGVDETVPAKMDNKLNLPITMTELKKIKKEKGTDAYLKYVTSPDYVKAVTMCKEAGIDFNAT